MDRHGRVDVKGVVEFVLGRIFRHLRQSTGKENPTICEARLHALFYLIDLELARTQVKGAGTNLTYIYGATINPECDCDGCSYARKAQSLQGRSGTNSLGGTGDPPFKRVSGTADESS